MKTIIRQMLMLSAVIIFMGDLANATEKRKHQFGGHSMVYSGKMELSKIDPEFSDLSGGSLDGVHHSSFFLKRNLNEHFRIGIETLVGNSEANGDSMNFQGAGLTFDGIYGNKYFIATGIHVGAIIVNATHSDNAEIENGVYSGKFYKDSGVFLAPHVEVGVRWTMVELTLTVKHVQVALGEKNDDIKAFSGIYTGLGWAILF